MRNIYTLICSAELDGILFASERFRNQPLIRRIREHLEKRKIPSLALGDNGGALPILHAKQRESMYHITRHLIVTHGCRRIWCIAGTPDSYASAERTAGFRQAMEEAGLPVPEDRIVYGNFWKDVPQELGRQIASGELERPDAVVCASDVMAGALIDALEAGGLRVPEDIAVTGYDGGWYSFLRGITTVSGRDRQLSADAVCALSCRMQGRPPERSALTQTLHIRTSCGCTGAPSSRASLPMEQYLERQVGRLINEQEFLPSNLVERFTAVTP